MSEHHAFHDLIRRVQAGDEQAATDLVRQYEPIIRMIVRRRLTDPRMRRLLDSLDICQSVLGTFFVGAAAGQFELSSPDDLLKLLATMARNKLISCARKQQAARRTPQGFEQAAGTNREAVDPQPTPNQMASNKELFQEVLKRLSPEERRIQEMYAAGCSWPDIAKAIGGSPGALRMQFARALDRIKRQLGLED